MDRRVPKPGMRVAAAVALPALLAACGRDETPQYREPQWQLAPSTAPAPAGAHAAPDGIAAPGGTAAGQPSTAAVPAPAPRPARPLHPEVARAAARTVPGVVSVAWVDEHNLLARVEDPARLDYQTIDEICYQLAQLGDAAGVVVNLQGTRGRSAGASGTLGRDCSLPPGQRQPGQAVRDFDALDPQTRAQYERSRESARRRPQTAGDRRALEAIPEM